MMSAHLTRFLTGYIGRAFAPGDCCLLLADWWRANHGADPAEALRPRLRTERDQLRMVADAGGVEALVAGIVASVGAAETASPERGDFGVLATPAGAVGAIRCSGGLWAARSPDGIAFVRTGRGSEVVRAWRI